MNHFQTLLFIFHFLHFIHNDLIANDLMITLPIVTTFISFFLASEIQNLRTTYKLLKNMKKIADNTANSMRNTKIDKENYKIVLWCKN